MTDEEILAGYLEFLSGDEWSPVMYELVDLSEADLREVTATGLAELAEAVAGVFEQAGVSTSRTAVYSARNMPFGLARIYEAYTFESPESVQVFRDRDQALRWLID